MICTIETSMKHKPQHRRWRSRSLQKQPWKNKISCSAWKNLYKYLFKVLAQLCRFYAITDNLSCSATILFLKLFTCRIQKRSDYIQGFFFFFGNLLTSAMNYNHLKASGVHFIFPWFMRCNMTHSGFPLWCRTQREWAEHVRGLKLYPAVGIRMWHQILY